MTARERAELEALVSPATSLLRAGLYLLAVAAIGWVARSLQYGATSVSPPVWLLPTGAFAAFLYVRGARWTGGRALRAAVRRDLERGELALHRVRVVEALEAPEVEDEGPVFFVRDAGGDTLFFSGQEMARHKARGFPWTEFEIVEAPASKQFLRLRSGGPPFEGVELREPLGPEEAKRIGVDTAPFGMVEASIEELRSA